MATSKRKRIAEPDFDRLMALARGFQTAKTFLVANQLEIFSILSAKRGKSAPEAARTVRANSRALRMLLDALVALEVVQKKEDRYFNTPLAEEFLVKGKESYRGAIFHHLHHTWEAWSHLKKAVIKGTSPKIKPEASLKEDRERTEAFIRGMYSIARGTAPKVTARIELSKVKKMLDLGGGPGTYAIYFAQKNPRLKAVVFDLPLVIPITKEIIKHHRMEKRVKTKAGDFHEDDFGKGYDLILMSQILHSNSEKECQALIKKAYNALKGGAQIVIHEFAVDESRTQPPMAVLFALHMLVNTSQGTTYTPTEMSAWLRLAGCKRTKVKKVPGTTTLVMGWK